MLNILSLISIAISFGLLVIALTVHEFCHALAADTLGDPTPRSQGRLTLNPLAHLDPIGTLMLLFAHFGWGKPVQIDPYNFRNPRRDEIIVALAGPGSNLILAIVTSLIIRFTNFYPQILLSFVEINLILAVFNFIPIPPLDGSKLLLNLLPLDKSIDAERFLDHYGYMILIALFILPLGQTSFLSQFLSPIITGLLKLLLG